MNESKSRWSKMSDSAAQATKTVVTRTQTLARQIDSGVRKEALDDVRRAREVVRKADAGLSQLFDKIEHWALVPSGGQTKAAEPADQPKAGKTKSANRGAVSQPS